MIYEAKLLEQCLWQMINSDIKLDNQILFKEDYMTIGAEFKTLFGLDQNKEYYVYFLNFSMN